MPAENTPDDDVVRFESHPRPGRRVTCLNGERFEDIGDRSAIELFQFQYGRARFSVRRSDRLSNLNVWLPLNVEDRFVGAIDRIDSCVPVIRVLSLAERSLDTADRILCAALDAYDQRATAKPSCGERQDVAARDVTQ